MARELSLLLFGVMTVLGCVVSARAAPADGQPTSGSAGASTGDLGEVIVTARRMEERLQDVPISITVLNQQQLTNRNVLTANDLATYVPSLAANARFGPENATFAIRGFTQEASTSPSVGVYFADVVAPRALSGTTGGNGAGPGDFFDLQNVQVLKGPQGTLFGRNTTGGAILLVPQKPTGSLEGYVEGSTGNYSMRRVQAVVNVPLSDIVRFRVGVDGETREGYLNNRSGTGPEDFADIDYYSARASLVVDLTPNLENYAIARFSNSDSNGTIPRLIACNDAAFPLGRAACDQLARQTARGDGYWDVENDVPGPRQHIEQWQVIDTTTWRTSDTLTVKNIASYSEFREQLRANIFGENLFLPSVLNIPTPTGIFNVPTEPLAGTPVEFVHLGTFPGVDNASQWSATEELQLHGLMAEDRLTWQAGAYVEVSKPIGPSGTRSPVLINCSNPEALRCFDVFSPFIGGFPLGSVTDVNTDTSFRNLGIYSQSAYNFSDQLSLTGGLRYTADRTQGSGQQVVVQFPQPNAPSFYCENTVRFPGPKLVTNEAECRVSITERSERPTWLIDLDYKPNDNILIYEKYARGYRQGSVNVLVPGFEGFGPEKVDAYEIGAKTSFHGAVRGTVNLAAFYNDLSDQQLQANAIAKPDTGVANANAIVNAGKSRISGVEVDASLIPFDGFTVEAAYTYLDTKLKSISLPTLPASSPYDHFELTALAGGSLNLSPKNKFTLTGTYTLPLNAGIGLISVGATFSHTDRQIATEASPFGVLPATDLLNLNLNWRSLARWPVDFALFATNVTNRKYPVFVGGSYTSVGFEGILLGEPRMYGARVRYRFGD